MAFLPDSFKPNIGDPENILFAESLLCSYKSFLKMNYLHIKKLQIHCNPQVLSLCLLNCVDTHLYGDIKVPSEI